MFLGERQLAPQQSLVIGATHNDNNNNNKGVNVSEILRKRAVGRIQNFIEVWDYAGDTIYRGFVAADGNRRTLFVFFDNHICAGQGLKSGFVHDSFFLLLLLYLVLVPVTNQNFMVD